jgi:hypothetical protein
MGKGHFSVLLIVRLNPTAMYVSKVQAVPFLNGSKQKHSLTIQLVHHNREGTVKRGSDSMK